MHSLLGESDLRMVVAFEDLLASAIVLVLGSVILDRAECANYASSDLRREITNTYYSGCGRKLGRGGLAWRVGRFEINDQPGSVGVFGITGCSLPPIWIAILGLFEPKYLRND